MCGFFNSKVASEGIHLQFLPFVVLPLPFSILQFAITAAIITVCTMGTLFQYSDKTLVFVYFFLFGLSGIMLLSLISTFSHEQNRLWQLELLLFLEPFSLIIRSMTKLFLLSKKSRRNFASSVLSANKKITSAKLSLWSEIAPVIPPASLSVNNICKSIMFACATCRIQLQMQVCARKVRETATFIAVIWGHLSNGSKLSLPQKH
ncbi:uncharacterized protein LOC110921338 isoform X3 [Helianthus annuus]|uniref:uncharacterized protein LOC110921338 isoform X3 n=1 Tax=Helianthus annuus TaxID=4232 RepID=UPI000B8F6A37|nr:uncharacterized protein LOC110921338 isoform X3 [Helianthus annuus]